MFAVNFVKISNHLQADVKAKGDGFHPDTPEGAKEPAGQIEVSGEQRQMFQMRGELRPLFVLIIPVSHVGNCKYQ